jgi:hypothetical protein
VYPDLSISAPRSLNLHELIERFIFLNAVPIHGHVIHMQHVKSMKSMDYNETADAVTAGGATATDQTA